MITDTLERADRFVASLPQARALGLLVVAATPGVITLALPYHERLIGDPVTRVVHGGAVSTLLDTCSGGAVLTHPDMGQAATATLDLRIDYMRGAPPTKAITARAACYHVTHSVAFVRATAWVDDDETQLIATATGAFTATHADVAKG